MATTNIILLTGFLGAGKTTVLKQMLTAMSTDNETKIGIIVNEFGKVSIDGPVLQQPGVRINELNNGSIFCQCLSGAFVDSIALMLNYELDVLLIESSGLSDPSNMQDMLEQVRKKTDRPYEYAGVLCVVDAKYFRKLSQSLNTITRQILASTLVVINKADLVSPEELESVRRSIQRLNPMALVRTCSYGRIDLADLQRLRRSRLGGRLPTLNTPAGRPKTLLLLTTDPFDRDRLVQFIRILQDRVYRLKGLLRLDDGFYHLDVVGGEISLEQSNILGERSELVIIPQPGADLRQEVQQLLADVLQIQADLV